MHFACIDCFKRCYYGDLACEPKFPYSLEILDEYEADMDNPKWDLEYPLIRQYDIAWDKWEEEREIIINQEDYLKRCPMCRK